MSNEFCEYCGGNDDSTMAHCRDCERPIRASDAFDMAEILESIVAANGKVSQRLLKEAKSALKKWQKAKPI